MVITMVLMSLSFSPGQFENLNILHLSGCVIIILQPENSVDETKATFS